MKLTKYITTACIAALFTGCDYLDFDETTGMRVLTPWGGVK